jgi:hypothetical protein
MKKIIVVLIILTMNSGILAQTKKFDILTYTAPAKFKLLEEKKRLMYQLREGNSFCVVQIWPAQQGSSDPAANFKTDWDYFAGNQYNIGEPKETQTEKQSGWDIVTGVGFAEVDSIQFLISVSTFTEGDISWCAITQFNDEKYAMDINKFIASIKADTKKFVRKPNPPVNVTVNNNNNGPGSSKPVSNGFHFTTTNFDDGWVAIPQEDWVLATKGNIKAHIHYPNKQADEYNPDGDAELKKAWNILVAPRYSNAANMFFKSGYTFESTPNYGAAEITDNATGKRVYVVLYKRTYYNGNNKYVEIIAPNQNAFEAMFGNYETNKANKTWDALNNMQEKNKFAVAASDLNGTWTSDFGAAVMYVYVATGNYAGMDTHGSAENFQFTGGSKYNWSLSVASGQVGNMRFQGAKSTGTVSVPDNWHIQFSDIEGKPKMFEAMFSCIKGLRILWLDGKPYAKKD